MPQGPSRSPSSELLYALRCGDSIRSHDILLTQFHLGSLDLEYQGERTDGAALFWAVCNDLRDLVELLLIMGSKVNAKTKWGATALHAAADNNRLNISRYGILRKKVIN